MVKSAISLRLLKMNDTGVASKERRVLDAQFPGRRFAVFYREDDGPDRDVSEGIVQLESCAASAGDVDDHLVPAAGRSPVGSAEFLRIEVVGGVSGDDQVATSVVTSWAVGRVSLRVEARAFDESLTEDRQAAAEVAFISSWALRMQVGCRRHPSCRID